MRWLDEMVERMMWDEMVVDEMRWLINIMMVG